MNGLASITRCVATFLSCCCWTRVPTGKQSPLLNERSHRDEFLCKQKYEASLLEVENMLFTVNECYMQVNNDCGKISLI